MTLAVQANTCRTTTMMCGSGKIESPK
jgi:hypothetical protein